jgi:hypothetical protein
MDERARKFWVIFCRIFEHSLDYYLELKPCSRCHARLIP